jgi:hypothetical protein
MIKRKRECIFCHRVGISAVFDTGNQLKQHIRSRHPRTATQKREDRASLKAYRTQQILLLARLGLGK